MTSFVKCLNTVIVSSLKSSVFHRDGGLGSGGSLNEADADSVPSSPPSNVALTSMGSGIGAPVSFIKWAPQVPRRDPTIGVDSR